MSDKISAADDLSSVVISEYHEEAMAELLLNDAEIVESSAQLRLLTATLCANPFDTESAAKIIDITTEYMEQPQLLDPLLASLVGDLTKTCLRLFGSPFPEPIYCCIYTLSNIRGFRELLPLFPNEVLMFEPVSNAFCGDCNRWEVRHVLLLWLSQLALVPFDIASSQSTKRTKLIADLISKSVALLSSPTKDSEAAAFFLSRVLLRKDMTAERDSFIATACTVFGRDQERLVTGYLRTVFFMLTSYDRLWVLGYASDLLAAIAPLADSPSAHHQLFHLKVIQQIALAFLPPRVAAWRYQRGKRTIKIGEAAEPTAPALEEDMYANEDSIEVPLEVNSILGTLFNGLGNPLTIVRWSAAKGVGRIVERLPIEFATQGIDYTFSLFEDKDNYNVMNGACLCLAEFTLRGCLLPSRVIEVIPLVVDSLIYDVKLGSHSVAENVRDSGCFVCWAIARAYDGQHLEPVALQIAQQLVNVFLFDRSVNVRRSASAAFQENVGRHGRFPHGLELIHVADFLSVSSRVGCYMKIAPFVAQFPEYGISIVTHLVNDRIKHWDIEIRALAAESLSGIAKAFPALIADDIVKNVCESCASFDIEVKHGGFEALAGLLRAIEIDHATLSHLLVLSDDCQSEEIKCAFVKMLSSAAQRQIPVPNLAQVLRDWLLGDSASVQQSAIQALRYLSQSGSPLLSPDFFDGLLGQIASPGVAAAIAVFPVSYLENQITRIASEITNLLTTGGPKITTKSNLLESLISLSKFTNVETLGGLLKLGLNDRTTTKRGDEGAAVRSTALRVSLTLLPNPPIAIALLDDILKLCLDRMSGIRESAIAVLKKTVETTESLPHRDELSFVSEPNAGDFSNFARLIPIGQFGEFVCEKLILCVGALAPDLSQRSGNAIVEFIEQSESNAVVTATLIVELFRKLRTDPPFTSALFSFLPRILNADILKGDLLADFSNRFLDLTKLFLKKVYFRKLMAAAPALAGFTAICSGEQRQKAFALFAPFFVCEFPVVRDKAATELANAFVNQSFCDAGDSDFDDSELQRLAAETPWKTDFDASAKSLITLCEIFRVDVPPIEKKEAPQEKPTFNYASLVKDAG
jgi:hypothetical protein